MSFPLGLKSSPFVPHESPAMPSASSLVPYRAMCAPEEQPLVSRVAEGDEAALRELMDRHDLVVRFTIFRTARQHCLRDPQWLDAVAGETWEGFIRSARRQAEIQSGSVARYLTGIARRQTISAIRRI